MLVAVQLEHEGRGTMFNVIVSSSVTHYDYSVSRHQLVSLTLRLLMSCIYGDPSKARNANVVYIWTYVWQR